MVMVAVCWLCWGVCWMRLPCVVVFVPFTYVDPPALADFLRCARRATRAVPSTTTHGTPTKNAFLGLGLREFGVGVVAAIS